MSEPEIPRRARGRRNQYFDAEGVDEIISMVLELTAEVSALRERQYLLERVLEGNGIDAADGIEQYQRSARDDDRLAADRDRLIRTVMRNLQAGDSTQGPTSADDVAA
ncbi:MAG: hypothetical protein ABR578_03600 [Chromatocurvus sp.]